MGPIAFAWGFRPARLEKRGEIHPNAGYGPSDLGPMHASHEQGRRPQDTHPLHLKAERWEPDNGSNQKRGRSADGSTLWPFDWRAPFVHLVREEGGRPMHLVVVAGARDVAVPAVVRLGDPLALGGRVRQLGRPLEERAPQKPSVCADIVVHNVDLRLQIACRLATLMRLRHRIERRASH